MSPNHPITESVIRDAEQQYLLPKKVEIQEYEEPTRQANIIQLYFRDNPYGKRGQVGKMKFAAEIEIPFSTKGGQKDIDIFERQLHKTLRSLSESWKEKCRFIIWNGTPYGTEFDDNVFKVWCASCGAEESVTTNERSFHKKKDLLMLYLLPEISHPCEEVASSVDSIVDTHVTEGDQLPRM